MDREPKKPKPRKPTNPELWERVKASRRATDIGTPPGRWGLRKSVLAQLDYAAAGETFE